MKSIFFIGCLAAIVQSINIVEESKVDTKTIEAEEDDKARLVINKKDAEEWWSNWIKT